MLALDRPVAHNIDRLIELLVEIPDRLWRHRRAPHGIRDILDAAMPKLTFVQPVCGELGNRPVMAQRHLKVRKGFLTCFLKKNASQNQSLRFLTISKALLSFIS